MDHPISSSKWVTTDVCQRYWTGQSNNVFFAPAQKMGSGVSVTAGFALFFSLVAVLLVGLLFFQQRFRPTTIMYATQVGVSAATDTFNSDTGVYIANQNLTGPMTLTINGDSSFVNGHNFYIKNASGQPVTIAPANGLAISGGGIQNPLTVTSGQTAWFLFTAPNVALRLI